MVVKQVAEIYNSHRNLCEYLDKVIHRTETEFVVHFCQRIVGDIRQGHPRIMGIEIRPDLSREAVHFFKRPPLQV